MKALIKKILQRFRRFFYNRPKLEAKIKKILKNFPWLMATLKRLLQERITESATGLNRFPLECEEELLSPRGKKIVSELRYYSQKGNNAHSH